MIEMNIRRGGQYLQHEGHSHLWTHDANNAMTYTRKDVAVALCIKMGGDRVEDLKTKAVQFTNDK